MRHGDDGVLADLHRCADRVREARHELLAIRTAWHSPVEETVNLRVQHVAVVVPSGVIVASLEVARFHLAEPRQHLNASVRPRREGSKGLRRPEEW